MTSRVLLETASLRAPGADRGLGRYTNSWIQGYEASGVYVEKLNFTNKWELQRSLSRRRFETHDLYHSTSVFGLPMVKNRTWICSIQDVIPLDLNGYTKLGLKTRIAFLNARRADLIVANSTYTADRIRECTSIETDQIVEVSLPVAPAFTQFNREGVRTSPYLCALVDLRIADARKRNHWLEPIAAALRKAGVELRITGRGLDKAKRALPSAVIVETRGDEALAHFFAQSRGFIYTTAYEGQGMPPIEAMTVGTPVIAFRNTALPQMIGESQILMDDPIPWSMQKLGADIPSSAVSSIVDAGRSLVLDDLEYDARSRAAVTQASRFTFEKFTEQITEFLGRWLAR